MGTWTNGGLNLVASAIQSAGPTVNITWVGISTGCGVLSAGLTSGVPVTSLPLVGTLPANLGASQSLTITDGTHTDTCTTNGAQTAGATSITVNSFSPAHSYTANVTGVAPTPAASDTALYNEGLRVAATVGTAGASAGESLNSGYFDGSQATAIYLMVGFFGGSTATSATGTGTLMIEDVGFWNHVLNADSNMFQADSTI